MLGSPAFRVANSKSTPLLAWDVVRRSHRAWVQFYAVRPVFLVTVLFLSNARAHCDATPLASRYLFRLSSVDDDIGIQLVPFTEAFSDHRFG